MVELSSLRVSASPAFAGAGVPWVCSRIWRISRLKIKRDRWGKPHPTTFPLLAKSPQFECAQEIMTILDEPRH
jgi:hypothetical protein